MILRYTQQEGIQRDHLHISIGFYVLYLYVGCLLIYLVILFCLLYEEMPVC
jgi:hypothetical protein